MGRCDQSMMGRCEQQGSMGRCSEQGNMGGRYEQGSMGRCEQGSMGRCGERMDASRMSVACASVGGGSASDYLHCGCTPGNHHHPHIDVTDMTRLQDTLDWPPGECNVIYRLTFRIVTRRSTGVVSTKDFCVVTYNFKQLKAFNILFRSTVMTT